MLAANGNFCSTQKYSLQSKWNLLFDKSPEWISFKPGLGLKVYPCYSCKNMFSSKLTFQDHINRRVIIIKYKCTDCTNTFTFYNRCSFLLHTRKHYSLDEGHVNLANVDITLLPVELAGFSRYEGIPFIYDEEEEFVNDTVFINSQFYTPDDSEAGKEIITLRPYNLVFQEAGNDVPMVVKQISLNVPVCKFVAQECNNKQKEPTTNVMEPEVKIEPDDFTLPIISKIESLNSDVLRKYPNCSECLATQEVSIAAHFLGCNRPLDQKLSCHVCKFIAPTKCSLKAHFRIHENAAPYVCPECGKVFVDSELLTKHMEDMCFHMAKQVRFRCPALKCGKIFVMTNTYASHFANHFQTINQCSVCSAAFLNENDFNEHAKNHSDPPCKVVRIFNCTVCKNIPSITEDKCAEHISWHLQDRERCVYIFTCKYCRSYFRSTTTYAVHKQRCSKSDKAQTQIVVSCCQFCGQRLTFREKDNYKTCPVCKQVNHTPMKNQPVVGEKAICMLCKQELTEESKEDHSRNCKYNNPVVPIQNISDDSKDVDEFSNTSEKLTGSDVDSKISNLDTSTSTDSPVKSETDTTKKKRKRSSNGGNPRSKKPSIEENSIDLQADEPVSFDGTYYCNLCDFKNADRNEFHNHIVTHRDVSTAYQCMECGECFVVKPSLIKHLLHYHKIEDANAYFAKNDCYDKFAVEELKSQLTLFPSEHRGSLKENQCAVCFEEFQDALSLDKHFRIHGMAFLLKTTK